MSAFPAETKASAATAEALIELLSAAGRDIVLTVDGYSMGATIAPSAEVVVRRLDRAPRFGEVLLVRGGKTFFVHRLVKVRSGVQKMYITRGDNCRQADPAVPAEKIIGTVVGIRKADGLWVPWHWRRPFSLLAAVVVRSHPLAWEPYARLFRRMDYYNWRAQHKWAFFRGTRG